MKFKNGDKVTPSHKSSYQMSHYGEKRDYMIVTDIDMNGWFQTDNERFNYIGGHWNPDNFEVYTVEVIPITVDEELFSEI